MKKLGDGTTRPFLQDVIQVYPLLNTLFNSAIQDFITPMRIIPHVGPLAIVDFLIHVIAMVWFTFLADTMSPVLKELADQGNLSLEQQYSIRRLIDQWKYGSGRDYDEHT